MIFYWLNVILSNKNLDIEKLVERFWELNIKGRLMEFCVERIPELNIKGRLKW